MWVQTFFHTVKAGTSIPVKFIQSPANAIAIVDCKHHNK